MPKSRLELISVCSLILGTGLVLGTAHSALALQPLTTFVDAGRVHAVDNEEARATADVQEAQADVSLGRLLPGGSVKASYTRNQYEAVVSLPTGDNTPPVSFTLTPSNQLDFTATLSVPLVDLAAYTRLGAARDSQAAAASQVAATRTAVDGQVIQAYYQLVADLALVTEAQGALDVARASETLSEQRFHAGSSTQLDVARAKAQVEQQVQQLAGATLQVALAAQDLETLTGVHAETEPGAIKIEDDLRPEQPLEAFAAGEPRLPQIEVAAPQPGERRRPRRCATARARADAGRLGERARRQLRQLQRPRRELDRRPHPVVEHRLHHLRQHPRPGRQRPRRACAARPARSRPPTTRSFAPGTPS